MFRNIYTSIFIFVFGAGLQAQEVFLHSPMLKTADFLEWTNTTNKMDIRRWFKGKTSIQNLNRLPISSHAKSLRQSLQMLDQQPILATELETSIYIYQKIGIENLSLLEKKRFLGLITSSETTFTRHENEIEEISRTTFHKDPQNPRFWLSAQEISSLLPFMNSAESLILVDGVPWENPQQKISPFTHQWLYISNSAEPIMKLGDFNDFLKALNSLKPLGETCGELASPWEGLPGLKLINVGTDLQCRSNGPSKDWQTSFAGFDSSSRPSHSEKISAWTVPLVILGSGAALSYFRNKQISFHLPNF